MMIIIYSIIITVQMIKCNKGGIKVMDIVIPLTIRFSDTARRKLRVIAGYEDTSVNSLIAEMIDERIKKWERTHGEIEIPKK